MVKNSNSGAEKNRPAGVRVTAAKCVRCKQPVTPRFRPFCSQRCTDLDLASWLTGQYRISTDETPDGSEIDLQVDED